MPHRIRTIWPCARHLTPFKARTVYLEVSTQCRHFGTHINKHFSVRQMICRSGWRIAGFKDVRGQCPVVCLHAAYFPQYFVVRLVFLIKERESSHMSAMHRNAVRKGPNPR